MPAYETRSAGGAMRERLRAAIESGEVDAALFTSSSTVTETVRELGDEAVSLLGRVVVASIGPITTQTLERSGIRVDVTAERYTVDGLLDALERHYASASSST